MNNITVELLHYTPMTVLLKALSMPYKKEASDLSLAQKVINVLKHESVAEHVTMNFLIDGVSRSELQEHMRHRIASTTCESTRFTLQVLLDSLGDYEHRADVLSQFFVTPFMGQDSEWRLKNERIPYENYYDFLDDLDNVYNGFIDFADKWHTLGLKNDFIKYGLPEGYATRFVWTINLRSLKNFLDLRSAPNAHFEIRHVADLITRSLFNTYVFDLLK